MIPSLLKAVEQWFHWGHLASLLIAHIVVLSAMFKMTSVHMQG
jgi:hypothetical protein